jgi:hypothetical protein
LQHTEPDVIGSWGLSGLNATQIVKNVNGSDFAMAALVLKVEGFAFQGDVYVALDEGVDYYRIYFLKDGDLQEQRCEHKLRGVRTSSRFSHRDRRTDQGAIRSKN